jgi:DNA replication protein DnaC
LSINSLSISIGCSSPYRGKIAYTEFRTPSVDYPRFLLRITELELLDRERRAIERRIRQARFPFLKSLDSFEFLAIPSLNKAMVLEMARCEFIGRRENVLLLGNSGTGKTDIALQMAVSYKH